MPRTSSATTRWRTSRRISGSGTRDIRPRDGSGIPAEHIRSWGWTRHWSTTGISPITYSVTEYLGQKGIKPLFLTDTEVSVLLFDLLNRVYGYPLEYILEALAPTTERDFHLLSEEKQKVYRAIQSTHLHRSPDGPWFFIISRNDHLQRQAPADRHHRHLDAAAAGVRPGRGRDADRSDRLGEAGHRFCPAQPGQCVQVPAAAGGHVLERQRWQPYRWRFVHLQPREGGTGQGPPAHLQQQVRCARDGPGQGVRPGARTPSWPHPLPKGRTSALADRMLSGTVEQGYQMWKQAVLSSSAQESSTRYPRSRRWPRTATSSRSAST